MARAFRSHGGEVERSELLEAHGFGLDFHGDRFLVNGHSGEQRIS